MPGITPDRRQAPTKAIYRFGEYEVRPGSGELFRNGARVRIQEQSLQVLLALLENPGELVSRDQLRERLWPDGTYVDFENSLNAAVKRLRAALDDDAENPQYIETLPKRGYRIVADVSVENIVSESIPAVLIPEPQNNSLSEHRLGRKKVWVTIAILAVFSIGIATLIMWRSRRDLISSSGTNIPSGGLPQKGEASELYLRSLSYKYEFPVNAQAIQLLERSVALDSSSARTWYELARRYRIEFTMTARGQGYFNLARDANRRALELAPDFSPAKMQRVLFDAESGQLDTAYSEAHAMVRASSKDFYAHRAMSIVLAQGGMFEDAANECETASKLDASNSASAGCSFIYLMLGQYERAGTYADLDPLSALSRFRKMEIAILQNDKPTALETIRTVHTGPRDYPDARLMEAVLSGAPPEIIRQWADETEALHDRISIPSFHYVEARYLAYAGQPEAALRFLRRAVANNFCGYPAMDSDPLLVNVRRFPEYKEIRQAGINCRDNFRAQMKAADRN